MAIDGIDGTRPPGAASEGDAPAQRHEIAKLAQEFEAMLMTQMLREMRRSMLDETDETDGFGASTLTDIGDVELGRALSRMGGMGLGDGLVKAFERQLGAQRETGSESAGAAAAAAASIAAPREVDLANVSRQSLDTASALPISSAFGWRQDPVTGVPTFHRGVDLAVAYGRDVRAAAAGTVVFSGTQGGYGQTVLIEHGDGRQTRYAHLSQQFVQAGEVVTGGQVVGRSGNSGRTTGPHLHFEMLVDGRPVDPLTEDR